MVLDLSNGMDTRLHGRTLVRINKFNYIFDNKMLKFYHKRCTQTTQFNFQREFFILLKFLIALTLFLMEIGMLLKKC